MTAGARQHSSCGTPCNVQPNLFSHNSDPCSGPASMCLQPPATMHRQLQKCSASKPWSCKWLLSCDAAASCKRFFPGEMSGASISSPSNCRCSITSKQKRVTVQPAWQLQGFMLGPAICVAPGNSRGCWLQQSSTVCRSTWWPSLLATKATSMLLIVVLNRRSLTSCLLHKHLQAG